MAMAASVGYSWEKNYSNLSEAKSELRTRMDTLHTKLESLKAGISVRHDLPSVPGADLKKTLDDIDTAAAGDLFDETEIKTELDCLEKALTSPEINKLASDVEEGDPPPNLMGFCEGQGLRDLASDFQDISLTDAQIEAAQNELDKIEKTAKSNKFFSQMVDIGQNIRLIYSFSKKKDEKNIAKSITELKKLLIRAEAMSQCQKKGFLSGKTAYESYFCNLCKGLYENLSATGGKKNSLFPLGRNPGEGPLLFPDFAMPFLAAAKKSNESLGASGRAQDDDLLAMAGDLVEIEQNNKRNEKAEMDKLYARLKALRGGRKRKTRRRRLSNKKKTRKRNKKRRVKTRKGRKARKGRKTRKR